MTLHNQEENANIQLKNLSFDELLDELGRMKLRLNILIPTIFEKGKAKGLTEIQIRDLIKKKIDIPESTLRPYLPEEAKKHNYPKHSESTKLVENDDKKVLEEDEDRKRNMITIPQTSEVIDVSRLESEPKITKKEFLTVLIGQEKFPSNWDKVFTKKEDNVFVVDIEYDEVRTTVKNIEVKGRKIALKLYS